LTHNYCFAVRKVKQSIVVTTKNLVCGADLRYDAWAGWSSLVARWAHNPKVAGSNPAPATNF
jgi:hypothetical protein